MILTYIINVEPHQPTSDRRSDAAFIPNHFLKLSQSTETFHSRCTHRAQNCTRVSSLERLREPLRIRGDTNSPRSHLHANFSEQISWCWLTVRSLVRQSRALRARGRGTTYLRLTPRHKSRTATHYWPACSPWIAQVCSRDTEGAATLRHFHCGAVLYRGTAASSVNVIAVRYSSSQVRAIWIINVSIESVIRNRSGLCND